MIRTGSIVLWLGLIVTGISDINLYTASPGKSDEAVSSCPKDSLIEANIDASHLLVFVHPHRPCSRSTVRELEQVLVMAPQIQATFVVFSDQDDNSSWHKSELVNHAGQLAAVHVDQDGQEARRFGVRTSGHAMLFAADGKCLFGRGVTIGRSHEGDSPGKLVLIDALLEQGTADRMDRNFAASGCPVQRAEEEG